MVYIPGESETGSETGSSDDQSPSMDTHVNDGCKVSIHVVDTSTRIACKRSSLGQVKTHGSKQCIYNYSLMPACVAIQRLQRYHQHIVKTSERYV